MGGGTTKGVAEGVCSIIIVPCLSHRPSRRLCQVQSSLAPFPTPPKGSFHPRLYPLLSPPVEQFEWSLPPTTHRYWWARGRRRGGLVRASSSACSGRPPAALYESGPCSVVHVACQQRAMAATRAPRVRCCDQAWTGSGARVLTVASLPTSSPSFLAPSCPESSAHRQEWALSFLAHTPVGGSF